MKLTLVEKLRPAPGYVLLRFAGAEKNSQPGQFYQLATTAKKMRVPLSVYGQEGSIISFFVKEVGPGSRALAALNYGNTLEATGPLGTCFTIPEGRLLLISGGTGYAPMRFLKNCLTIPGQAVHVHGGNTGTDVFTCDAPATMDGSLGFKGNCVEAAGSLLLQGGYSAVAACGPTPMLKAVQQLVAKYNIPAQLSLEAYMACGIGVCKGCVVGIAKNGELLYKTVCKDGPVFAAQEVVFD